MSKEFNLKTLKLIRHQLGSVDLSDIEEKEMSETETKDYNASISAVFPRLEKDIKALLHEQLMFIANQADTWDRVVFGRGTFNGMDILLEKWKSAHIAHAAKVGEEGSFDENEVIGEL